VGGLWAFWAVCGRNKLAYKATKSKKAAESNFNPNSLSNTNSLSLIQFPIFDRFRDNLIF